jgi:hypothetical protein
MTIYREVKRPGEGLLVVLSKFILVLASRDLKNHEILQSA